MALEVAARHVPPTTQTGGQLGHLEVPDDVAQRVVDSALDPGQLRGSQPGTDQTRDVGPSSPQVADEAPREHDLPRSHVDKPGRRVDGRRDPLRRQPAQARDRRSRARRTPMAVGVQAGAETGRPAEPRGDLVPREHRRQNLVTRDRVAARLHGGEHGRHHVGGGVTLCLFVTFVELQRAHRGAVQPGRVIRPIVALGSHEPARTVRRVPCRGEGLQLGCAGPGDSDAEEVGEDQLGAVADLGGHVGPGEACDEGAHLMQGVGAAPCGHLLHQPSCRRPRD